MEIMKKFHVVLLALFAVFAFSATVAGSASAETTLLAEWLFNGAAITALLPVETTGEVLLVTLVLGVEAVDIHCSGIFDGSVGPNGEDEITKLLNLEKEEIGSELVGLSLSCTVEKAISGSKCNVSELAELWADGLPWHSNLFLMESGVFLDSIGTSNSGYHVFCPMGGAEKTAGAENLCVGSASTTMTNGATDVTGEFLEPTAAEEAKCTTGSGMITGTGLTSDTSEGTLQVSSE
jgi:hypothetical protein